MRKLARADALRSLGLNRREALWHIAKMHNNILTLFEVSFEKVFYC